MEMPRCALIKKIQHKKLLRSTESDTFFIGKENICINYDRNTFTDEITWCTFN